MNRTCRPFSPSISPCVSLPVCPSRYFFLSVSISQCHSPSLSPSLHPSLLPLPLLFSFSIFCSLSCFLSYSHSTRNALMSISTLHLSLFSFSLSLILLSLSLLSLSLFSLSLSISCFVSPSRVLTSLLSSLSFSLPPTFLSRSRRRTLRRRRRSSQGGRKGARGIRRAK
jgi:hypothetical protein